MSKLKCLGYTPSLSLIWTKVRVPSSLLTEYTAMLLWPLFPTYIQSPLGCNLISATVLLVLQGTGTVERLWRKKRRLSGEVSRLSPVYSLIAKFSIADSLYLAIRICKF